MPTALVTGAAGFIGSHLVAELLENGSHVRGLDNCSSGSQTNLQAVSSHDRFTFIEGDIRDESTVQRAMSGVERVFHLAAATSVPGSFERPRKTTDINCTGTATLLETAGSEDIERFIFASSAAVYGSDVPVPVAETASLNPESPYALSKRYGESLTRQVGDSAGFETVSLRFFNVYGPGQDPSGAYAAVIPAFISRVRSGKPPVIYGDGEQTRDFVAVSDVVSALIRAGERPVSASVINIGGGRRVTINELAETLIEIVGRESSTGESESASGVENLEPVYESAREGDIRHSQADIARARELLGYDPQVSLREGLTRTVVFT